MMKIYPNPDAVQTDASGKEYFEIPRFSNSALTNFKRSPRHYLYHKKNPVTTAAMTIGSAFHCYILENEHFEKRYISLPDDAPKRPTSAQINAKKPSADTIAQIQWWNEFQPKCKGKELLAKDDIEMIKRMSEAVYAHTFARELLEEIGEVEKAMFWKDEVSGIEMKCKQDGVSPAITIDLKSCMNAHPDNATIDAFNNGYHRQASLYRDARYHNKMNRGDFYFIFCEKEEPYGVSVMKCTQDFIKQGAAVAGAILEDVRYWVEMGSPDVCYEWKSPLGYADLHLPPWVKI